MSEHSQNPQRASNGLAIISLGLGIVAIVFVLLFFPLAILLGLVGLILGFLGLRSGGGYAVGGIVLSGVAVLLGIAIGAFAVSWVTIAVQEKQLETRQSMAEAQMRAIASAAEMLYAQTGVYPKNLHELVQPIDGQGNSISGGLTEYPIDPWGNEYQYTLRDGRPEIVSLGRDGLPGGEGADADIRFPEPEADF